MYRSEYQQPIARIPRYRGARRQGVPSPPKKINARPAGGLDSTIGAHSTALFEDAAVGAGLAGQATIQDFPYATPAFIAEQNRLSPFNVRQDFYYECTPHQGCLLTRARVEKSSTQR